LQDLYDSEITCRVESFWDDGWRGTLGDEVNGFPFASVKGRSFSDCVAELARQACSCYPGSDFAARYRKIFMS
jgi:hypothetical protein